MTALQIALSFGIILLSIIYSHLEWFSNRVFEDAEHLLTALPSLHSPTHPKSFQLCLGRVIQEARSCDIAFHLSLS